MRTFLPTLVGLILASVVSVAAQDGDTKAARQSVESWLALTDGGKYAESWQTAAALFKKAVTRPQWEDALQKARAPLGALESRTMMSAAPMTNPPNAPAGTYVIFQFDTTFEQRSGAVETVTVVREEDGQWRAAGYFIK